MKRFFIFNIAFLSCIMGQSLPDTIPEWADLGVNGVYLADPYRVVAVFGNPMGSLIDSDLDLPYVNCKNKLGTQILKMIFHPGSRRNAFNEFEVLIQPEGFEEKSITTPSIDEFISFKGIKLGSSFSEVVRLLGNSYQYSAEDNEILYLHDVLGDEDTAFLDHYNMPIYYARYRFENGKLIWFRFGFDNP